jgi:hypothetical protein
VFRVGVPSCKTTLTTTPGVTLTALVPGVAEEIEPYWCDDYIQIDQINVAIREPAVQWQRW